MPLCPGRAQPLASAPTAGRFGKSTRSLGPIRSDRQRRASFIIPAANYDFRPNPPRGITESTPKRVAPRSNHRHCIQLSNLHRRKFLHLPPCREYAVLQAPLPRTSTSEEMHPLSAVPLVLCTLVSRLRTHAECARRCTLWSYTGRYWKSSSHSEWPLALSPRRRSELGSSNL